MKVAHYCRRGKQYGFRITQKSYIVYETGPDGLRINGRWEYDISFKWLTDEEAHELGLVSWLP